MRNFKRKEINTPEQKVKNEVCLWLARHRRQIGLAQFWVNKSTGIFDQKLGIYRKDRSPWALKGVSDILGFFSDGRILAIELKTDNVKDLTGKFLSRRSYPTPEQQAFLAAVNRSGGVGFVARNIDDCAERLRPVALSTALNAAESDDRPSDGGQDSQGGEHGLEED